MGRSRRYRSRRNRWGSPPLSRAFTLRITTGRFGTCNDSVGRQFPPGHRLNFNRAVVILGIDSICLNGLVSGWPDHNAQISTYPPVGSVAVARTSVPTPSRNVFLNSALSLIPFLIELMSIESPHLYSDAPNPHPYFCQISEISIRIWVRSAGL